MQELFEDVWRRLPADARPADFALRRDWLLREARPGEKALDVGCGAGEFAAELDRAGIQVTGIEVAEGALDRARTKHPGVSLKLVGLEEPLPFADNSFDLVWAGELIEHIADTARWLSEVRRVLVPGGRLVLSTPNHGRLRLAIAGIERFSPPLGDHLHLYDAKSLRRVLEEFDFGEVEVRRVAGPPLLRRLLLARAVR